MGKKHRVRIDTSGTSECFGNDAFQGLSLEGLPDRPPLISGVSGHVPPRHDRWTPSPNIRLEVRREKSGRAGKTVTTVRGVNFIPEKQRIDLLKRLKKLLATGGTIVADSIEIQGDFADRVTQLLQKLGYRAVRSGG